jgi:pantoate--beta-alanine ligase
LIERIETKADMRQAVAKAREEGKTIGLVPTMGALHAGHMALVAEACGRADAVVVSIFVNPTQFGPDEDFERYPRRIEGDLRMLDAQSVEYVFVPSVEAMYESAPLVSVNPGPLAARWEGEVRPGHFSGMATAVAKLFGIVRPDTAFFGEKDYQQLAIVRRLALDLDLGVEVVGCQTMRDSDGLALSSRNALLSHDERERARALPHALETAQQAFAQGERDGEALGIAMRHAAGTHAPGAIRLDYAAVVDAETLEPLAVVDRPARAIIAAQVGRTRLIDNCELTVSGGERR